MTTKDMIDVWEITPHKESEYDYCIITVRSDPDGRKAMEYAQEVLEEAWDMATDIEPLDITARLRRTKISEDQLPDDAD